MQTNGFLTTLLTKSHDCEIQVNISVFVQENVKSQNTCKTKNHESWNYPFLSSKQAPERR